ncbi:unnamed protein product [Paramecium primaurelia]|uniref:Uncharacterized protein n=1 Tax=Paramecium primaurelia TaxID=5886 RepID=A0A8S1PAZ5_PARPR|nr:unnamed protein product [Paramecium primaurelia]
MRKRLGALHADSLEQYIQQSQYSKELLYQTKVNEKQFDLKEFENTDKDTNTSFQEEQQDQKEYCNINILIVDNSNQIGEVFKYCNTLKQPKSNYHLEYCSKVEQSNSKQVHFHFWIINQESSKYQELINVYFTIADAYIYIYHKYLELEFQLFTEKVKKLNNNQSSIIFKVANSKRVSSMNNLQENQMIIEITLQSLNEVLERVKSQFI